MLNFFGMLIMKQNRYNILQTEDIDYVNISEEIKSIARSIELLILDVDGVMTNGALYYNENGSVTKAFSAQDGLGIRILLQAGIGVSVITGADSRATASRLRTLGVTEHYRGQKNKSIAFEEILEKTGVLPKHIAYMGDDWIDIQVMQSVALPIAVANAQPEVKEIALLLTETYGGMGAIRDVARFLLSMQNKLQSALRSYL